VRRVGSTRWRRLECHRIGPPALFLPAPSQDDCTTASSRFSRRKVHLNIQRGERRRCEASRLQYPRDSRGFAKRERTGFFRIRFRQTRRMLINRVQVESGARGFPDRTQQAKRRRHRAPGLSAGSRRSHGSPKNITPKRERSGRLSDRSAAAQRRHRGQLVLANWRRRPPQREHGTGDIDSNNAPRRPTAHASRSWWRRIRNRHQSPSIRRAAGKFDNGPVTGASVRRDYPDG